MALFKIYFSEENIRKIKLDAVPTYQEFTSLLASLYPKLGSGEFLMKYQDEDGDRICIESQLEWEGMFQCITNDMYKLYIEQGTPVRKLPQTVPLTPLSEAKVPFTNISFGMFGENGFNFVPQDFEMPQATTFFQMFDASNAADIQTKLQSNLNECINNVFGQANNINECIKNFDLRQMETAVDDKVHEFSNIVYNKGVEVLGSERVDDLRRRKEQLIDALNAVPNHANNLYNLACAESRLGNVKESVDALDKAIRNGYQNFEQMLNDQELINIKHTQEYSDLINRIFSFAPTQDIVQEPVIEEPIPEPVQEKPVDLSASILPLVGTYGYELEILKSMGFTEYDTDVLLLLLEQYEGSVEQVTQFLLGFN